MTCITMYLRLVIAVAGTLFIVIFKLYHARFPVWKLQKQKLPMPPFSLITGHLSTLKKISATLPVDATIHTKIAKLATWFPNGIFYVNMWPFLGRTLMVVSTPFGAFQVQEADLEKPPDLREPLDVMTGGPSLITMHGTAWKTWRNLFNPGFSTGYMIGVVPAIVAEVEVFCNSLRQKATEGQLFQMEDLSLKLTVDVIGAVTLDTRLHCQTRHNMLASSLQKQIEWTLFATLNPFQKYLSVRPLVLWLNNRRMNKYIEARIDERLSEHKQQIGSPWNKTASRSVLSLILKQHLQDRTTKNQSGGLTSWFRRTTTAQLRLFLFAGRDTTSSTLLYCYYLLAKYPKVLDLVRAEHDGVFGKSITNVAKKIAQNPQLLHKIPYTLAVIKETLRLYPPAASMRQGRPGLYIEDEFGRKYPTEGCNIWVLTLALHHNPNVWKDAESFLPERWLVGPEDPLYPVKNAWRPFEFGSRSCIGQTLARYELRTALVMTLREFNIIPAYKEWDQVQSTASVREFEGDRAYQATKGGGGAHPADGLPCRVSFRKESVVDL